METLPYELKCLIMSYAHPIHPCKTELDTRLMERPAWHLWLGSPSWDEMSDKTKEWLYRDLETVEYDYY